MQIKSAESFINFSKMICVEDNNISNLAWKNFTRIPLFVICWFMVCNYELTGKGIVRAKEMLHYNQDNQLRNEYLSFSKR